MLCSRCGAYATQRLQRLAEPCDGQVTEQHELETGRQRTLAALMAGRHPGVSAQDYQAVVRPAAHPDQRHSRHRQDREGVPSVAAPALGAYVEASPAELTELLEGEDRPPQE